ncbi:hypothetical protein IKF27_00825 [Candidatus Saccharibacteria bacterium]|nr:hypothetical protein [Candidatus Saccharibacteria bacterium]
MKQAGVESKINWQNDTLDAQLEKRLKNSFEYLDYEGETTGNKEISQESLEKIRAFKVKERIGKSTVRAVGLLDKLVA